ncbi:methionine aminopeptidase 1D, chloroplastic/mitochondrial isoform X2 [Physcomitrium patens]|uniref:Methionine aminopeptidase n=1 Tax=Physcomitrium patens TaxID=3218 RepID=A0A7I4BB48_PHYPA|nr:methionine aminopeptidase 1D, chloroplastic/mitochondrial-like isoform X2 [Physcomitrium patens]|eukprot:XP_024399780.1 methionine aminopeptidase 1D, chloroplastic/mitochondrial-like isoform X2 [Physcomitrella patens]
MAPIGAMAAIRAVARHSLLTSLMRGSRSGCYSSSIWGSGRNFRNFMNSSSSKLRFPGSGHELQGCPSGRAGALLILARKKSGFAELFMNRRSGEQEKQVDGSRIRRPPLKRGKVSPRLEVPKSVPRPPYVDSRNAPAFLDEFQIQDAEGIKFMRASGQLAARVRDFAGTLVKAGVTTDEIDKAVHQMIIDAGAYPSPLGYGGFPKSVCTSVNECICHGIPDSRPLEDGDIVNVDVTVYLNGYHGDTSKTFYCGNVSDEAKQLVEVTKESLDKAISICGPGVEFKKIGRTINEIADKHGYGVVEHFVGHGVGKVFHSAPSILHNQPMLTEGSIRDVMWNDNWTCVTEDGGLSAQFEHSLLITESGVEILTL